MQTNITIWYQIASIPWTFYLIFFFANWIAYQYTKPHTIRVMRLKIAIGLELLLAIFVFVHPWRFEIISTWLAGFGMGSIIGWIEFQMKNARLSDDAHSIILPGSWLTFIFIDLIIICRFFIYTSFADEHSALMTLNSHYFLFILGVMTGFYSGRYLYYYSRIKQPPHSLAPQL